MSAPMNTVGSTALMIAHLRAQEAGRPDALFEDPLAPAFHHPPIAEAVAGWQLQYPFFPALVRLRTRFLDETVRAALDAGVDQVLVLGAGCCTRAARLARPGVTFYEVDEPAVLGFKADRLATAGAAYAARAVARNYAEPGLVEALSAAGLNADRPVVAVWEGNVYYLPDAVAEGVLGTLAGAFPRLTLAFDHFGPEVIDGQSVAPGARSAVEVLRRYGAPWQGAFRALPETARQAGLRIARHWTLRALAARYLPELSLGKDADVEYALTVLTR